MTTVTIPFVHTNVFSNSSVLVVSTVWIKRSCVNISVSGTFLPNKWVPENDFKITRFHSHALPSHFNLTIHYPSLSSKQQYNEAQQAKQFAFGGNSSVCSSIMPVNTIQSAWQTSLFKSLHFTNFKIPHFSERYRSHFKSVCFKNEKGLMYKGPKL